MKRTVNVYAICVVLVGLFFFSFGMVSAQDRWALGSAGAGSGPYVWGGAIANHINKHQTGVRISSQSTAGMNENIELVSSGQIHIGLQDGVFMEDAYRGKGVFQGHPYNRVRVLFSVVAAPWHLVTREASGIKTVYDLKGKKMNIGLPAQTTRVFNEAFLKAANIKLADIKVYEMATGQSFTALQDGVIDASGNLFSLGHGGLLELSNNTNIRLVSIPDEVLEDFIKSSRGVIKFIIPPNVYKGQNTPITTFTSIAVLFGRDDLPEDLVYKVTKAFWDNLEVLNKDPSFKSLKREQAYLSDLKHLYHPGALKYFRETGLAK
jgi:TRAP transporter TAXI family solute receptor